MCVVSGTVEQVQERSGFHGGAEHLGERQRQEMRLPVPPVEAQGADVERLVAEAAHLLPGEVDEEQMGSQYFERYVHAPVEPQDQISFRERPDAEGIPGSKAQHPCRGCERGYRLLGSGRAAGNDRQFSRPHAGQFPGRGTRLRSATENDCPRSPPVPAGLLHHAAERPAETVVTEQAGARDGDCVDRPRLLRFERAAPHEAVHTGAVVISGVEEEGAGKLERLQRRHECSCFMFLHGVQVETAGSIAETPDAVQEDVIPAAYGHELHAASITTVHPAVLRECRLCHN